MRRLLLILFVGALPCRGLADDSGLAKGGAAYLNFSVGARAIAMGQAQTAVMPEEASVLYSNPANLASLPRQSLTTTSGLLGLDRSLYFMGYCLPFRRNVEAGGILDKRDADLGPMRKSETPVALPKKKGENPEFNSDYQLLAGNFNDSADMSMEGTRWSRAFEKSEKTEMAVAAGMTYFGIENIEGRSEFGAPEADFQDAERAIYLAYAFKPYRNLGVGFSGKYLGQTLQSASASGFAFDVGVSYGVPYVRKGRLDLALAAKDIGGSLKWKVNDPLLNSEFSYSEPVLTKIVLGAAYASPANRWLWALDLVKTEEQNLRPYAGVEWRTLSYLRLRAGASDYNPTAGFGIDWNVRSVRFKLDYAFQYDLEALANPHWITLSMQFLGKSR